MMCQRSLINLAVFALSLLAFTVGLNHTEIVSFDSRFYVFAEAMWRHGWTWFPTTYGEPYPDYPVTSTALIYGVSLLLGGLSKFSAVLPSAVAAALVVVYTKKIGDLLDARLGMAAVGVLFLTLSFFKSARAISLDMYPLLAATICFYHLARAAQFKVKRSHLVLASMFILGFLFRGPVGLVIPAGVVSAFHLVNGNVRRFFCDGFHALFWLVAGTAGLLSLAFYVGGLPFVMDVARMEGAGRIDNYFLPYTFYFTDSFASYALAYPLAVLVAVGLVFATWRNQLIRWPRATVVWQWLAWALIILLGMSFPGDKKVRYVLGMVPAIGLMAAYPVIMATGSLYLDRLRQLFTFLFALLPLLFMVGLSKVMAALPLADLTIAIPFVPLWIFLAVVQAVSAFVWLKEKDAALRGVQLILLAALAFVVLDLTVIEPIEVNLDRAKVFVSEIEKMRADRGASLVFYGERPDGLPIKYLVNMNTEDNPVFVETTDELMAIPSPAVVVASTSVYQALSARQKAGFRVLSKGKIGHVQVTVFAPVK